MHSFAGRGGWWVVAQVALFGVICGALILGGDDWGLLSRLAGLVVGATGAMLAGWGVLALGENLSPYPHPRDRATLVEQGPYRIARHPVYGGLVVGGTGAGIFHGSWAALAATGVLGVLLYGKSRFEERRLLDRLPGYEEYRTRVRRVLIPWIV
jgi:protein-S-isoprenylcysteine O-methyltransferase Ste14